MFCLVTWLSQTVIQLFTSFWMESSMNTWRAGAISSIISVPPIVAGRDLHTNMAIESESVSCSVVSDSCNPMHCSLPGFLSMEFSRQAYWSGQPIPSPGDLPDPGIESRSPALQADTLTSEPPGKHLNIALILKNKVITICKCYGSIWISYKFYVIIENKIHGITSDIFVIVFALLKVNFHWIKDKLFQKGY